MQKQLSRTLSMGSQQSLPSVGDSAIKLRLMEFYLLSGDSQQLGGLLTVRDLQEWALDQGLDKNKVKQINQQLVNEGLLLERKRPTQFFQVALRTNPS